MHAFDVLGDPVRRRIVELLGDATPPSTITAGQISAIIESEFDISQPAVSRHLRILRENGFASVTVDGQRRLYAVDRAGLDAVDEWLERYRGFWLQRLDALDTELRRGVRHRASTRAGRTHDRTPHDETADTASNELEH